jgi:hypothetical protein
MVTVLFRIVDGPKGRFLESLVGGKPLAPIYHSRFETRIVERPTDHTALVRSSRSIEPPLIRRVSVETNGAWVAKTELVPRGVPLRPFGLEMDTRTAARLLELFQILEQLYCIEPSASPLVLWHGSQEPRQKLLESPTGMLGPGVYLGPFFKAVRFALFGQTYEPRAKGFVMRVYCFPDSILEKKDVCECPECRAGVSPAAIQAKTKGSIEPLRLADHLGVWRLTDDAVHVASSSSPDSSLRNEEYCVKETSCCVETIHSIAAPAGWNESVYHYDPSNRCWTIA